MARQLAARGQTTRIVTNNKYLQDQYMGYHFTRGDIPLLAKGRSNFLCNRDDVDPGTTADNAPCTHGERCPLATADRPENIPCDYYRQLKSSDASRISVLNYPLYFAERNLPVPIFDTDVLIADEGHNIDQQLIAASTVQLDSHDLRRLTSVKVRMPYVAEALLKDTDVVAQAKRGLRMLELEDDAEDARLMAKLSALINLQGKLAIAQGFRYAPVLPEDVARRFISGVSKTVLMSATIFGHEYWRDRLAMPDAEYIDVPSTFPTERRPIYVMPVTRMGVRWWQDREAQQKMARAIDEVIAQNMGRKGIIHSVSYPLTKWIMENSSYAASGYLFEDAPGTEVIERWRASSFGVLVSPKVTEGVDLPGELCEFVVFPKVPFLSLGDKVVQLQRNEIPGFYEQKAMAAIVQGAGRGMRSKDDSCRTYILDTSWFGLRDSMWGALPSWFTDAVVYLRKYD